MTRLSNAVPDLVDVFVQDFIAFFLLFIFAIYAFVSINVVLGIFLALFFFFIHIILVFFTPKLSKQSTKWFKQRSFLAGHILDLLSNGLSIKLFNGKRHEQKDLDKKLDKIVASEIKIEWGYFRMFFMLSVAYIVLQGGRLYFLLINAEKRSSIIADIVKVLYINESLMTAMWYDLPDLSIWSKSIGSIQQGLDILNGQAKANDTIHVKPLMVQKRSYCIEKRPLFLFWYKKTFF